MRVNFKKWQVRFAFKLNNLDTSQYSYERVCLKILSVLQKFFVEFTSAR